MTNAAKSVDDKGGGARHDAHFDQGRAILRFCARRSGFKDGFGTPSNFGKEFDRLNKRASPPASREAGGKGHCCTRQTPAAGKLAGAFYAGATLSEECGGAIQRRGARS